MRLPQTSVFYLQQAVLFLRAFQRRCYYRQECRMLFQLFFFQLKLHCKGLEKQNKTKYAVRDQPESIYLNEFLHSQNSAFETVELYIGFHIVTIRYIFMHLSKTETKNCVRAKARKTISFISSFMTCTLKNYFIMDSFSHQPFLVNTVKCFRIRPISINESCIFIFLPDPYYCIRYFVHFDNVAMNNIGNKLF